MRKLGLVLIASALASCSMAPPQAMPRSDRAEARLQRELAGLVVAGPPRTCIPNYRADQMVVVDDSTILFRDGTTRVWRNELQGGGCSMLGGAYTLVLSSPTPSLCSGEIGRVVELRSDTTLGSCALGPFVPYQRP